MKNKTAQSIKETASQIVIEMAKKGIPEPDLLAGLFAGVTAVFITTAKNNKSPENLENARTALKIMTTGVLDDLAKHGWE